MNFCGKNMLKIALVISLSLPTVLQANSEKLAPATDAVWTLEAARHLLERAGFGGTPEEVESLHAKGLAGAVDYLVYFKGASDAPLPDFEHSGIFDEGLDPFPPSRPATTALAEKNGEVFGIKVKPSGNRPMQAIVNKFFYWLRASRLETDRVAHWWGERMLTSPRPLEEKWPCFGTAISRPTKIRCATIAKCTSN